MKLFKKVLAGVAVAAALVAPAFATVTVQGISWDPGPLLGQFNFRQILSNTGELSGIGEFYYFGVSDYTSVGVVPTNPVGTGGQAGSFAPGRELTLHFYGFQDNGNGQFTGGFLDVFSDNHNDFAATTNTNVASATNSDYLTPFLTMQATASTFSTASGFTGFQSGTLDVSWSVISGAAAGLLDTDTFVTTFGTADVTSRASATFPTPFVGVYSQNGANGEFHAYSIPEPESLALVGFGLLGLAVARRRKSTKTAV
jgi:hypothetical protein